MRLVHFTTAVIYHFPRVSVNKTEQTLVTEGGEGDGHLELPYVVTGAITCYNPLDGPCCLLRNMNPFHSKAVKRYAHRQSGVRLHTLALLTVTTHSGWRERREYMSCEPSGEWIPFISSEASTMDTTLTYIKWHAEPKARQKVCPL